MDQSSDHLRRSKKYSRPADRHPSQKLDISYLLNDPTSDEKPDEYMLDPASSRDLRFRQKSVAGSSRKLSVPASVRERLDRPPVQPPVPASTLPWLICPQCGEPCGNQTLLQEHMARHQRVRSFVCEECDARFSEKGNLNRHIKSVHKKEKPWLCRECGTQFAFRDALTRHVNAVHRDLRPYPCDQCQSKFKKRAHLQRHIQTCHRDSSGPS